MVEIVNNEYVLKSKKPLKENNINQDNINENGIVDSDIYIKTKNGKTIIIAEGTNINDFINSENFTTKVLVENESIKFEENVNYIAKQMWAAFETQLFCIGARIPTQSMQSFMGLEVVGFSDSDVNEVYVPAVQTWLQGSDYQGVTSLTML